MDMVAQNTKGMKKMRDSLATEKHLNNMINYMREEIEWSKDSTSRIIAKKSEMGEDTSNAMKLGSMDLRAFYVSLINSLYSIGAPMDEINELFPAVFETFVGAKESGYADMLWIASIGIMLDAPAQMMNELARITDENNFSDYLLDFLFCSIYPKREKQYKEFLFPVPYEFLASVIEAETKDESLHLLQEYLDTLWYKGHKGEDWYNSHKNMNKSFYDGYWSFESGAIAKILHLEDTGWENQKYYPYDMVHYKNCRTI